MDLINLDSRIKALDRPTPQQVVNLISVMYSELHSNGYYIHRHTLGLLNIGEKPYARI